MNTTRRIFPISPNLAIYLVFLIFLLAGREAIAQETRRPIAEPLGRIIENSPVFSKIFTGFALYDPELDEFVFEKDADKYFTPASNTKLLTFYTALRVLGDSLPALRYVDAGDTLVFWGTGNPLFLHPALPQDTAVFSFLKNRPEALFFSPHNYEDERFGPGWSWRDYQYYYQVEKSPFPMYGNMVRFFRRYLREGFEVTPPYFRRHIAFNPRMDSERGPDVQRQEHANTFEYNAAAMTGLPFAKARPFRYAPSVVSALLTDTLDRVVQTLHLGSLPPADAHTINIAVPDTLYRRLMKDSDNFIAEQMLLLVSEKLYGVQRSERAIEYALDSLFQDAPDEMVWVDGSGLSRYNLFTPRTIVYVLHKIYHALPQEQLFDILPAGGVSGTIRQWYGGSNGRPYVFAKTGTLSNKHCLSGFLLTRRGKTLLFSFMNNNYINGTNEVKGEMEKVLQWIYQNY